MDLQSIFRNVDKIKSSFWGKSKGRDVTCYVSTYFFDFFSPKKTVILHRQILRIWCVYCLKGLKKGKNGIEKILKIIEKRLLYSCVQKLRKFQNTPRVCCRRSRLIGVGLLVWRNGIL